MALKVYFSKKHLCLLLKIEFIDRNSQFFCLFSFHPAPGAKETCIAYCFLCRINFSKFNQKRYHALKLLIRCESPILPLLFSGDRLFLPSCLGITETQALGRGVSSSLRANADLKAQLQVQIYAPLSSVTSYLSLPSLPDSFCYIKKDFHKMF